MYVNEKLYLSLFDAVHLHESAKKSKDPTQFLISGLYTYLDILEEHLEENFDYANFPKIIQVLSKLLSTLNKDSKIRIQKKMDLLMEDIRPFFLHLPLPIFQSPFTQSTLITCDYTRTYFPQDFHPRQINLDQFIFTNYWVWFPFYWLLSQYSLLYPDNPISHGLAPYIIQVFCQISLEKQEPLLLTSKVYQYQIHSNRIEKIK